MSFNLFHPLCSLHNQKNYYTTEQENLANAKVSVRQQCVCEGPSLEKKSTANQRKEHNVKKVHSVGRPNTTLSLTIPVYLHSFSFCCLLLPNLRNPAMFSENSNL